MDFKPKQLNSYSKCYSLISVLSINPTQVFQWCSNRQKNTSQMYFRNNCSRKICLAWYHFLAGKCNDYQTIIYTLMTCSSKWTGISKYSRRRTSLCLSPAVNDLSAAQTSFFICLDSALGFLSQNALLIISKSPFSVFTL